MDALDHLEEQEQFVVCRSTRVHTVVSSHSSGESTLWNELNKVEQGGNQYLHDLGAPEKWAPPAPGLVKCNMHANWRNDRYLTGGAWITRDHRGEVGMHTRDALL